MYFTANNFFGRDKIFRDTLNQIRQYKDDPNGYLIAQFESTHQPINEAQLEINLGEMLEIAENPKVSVMGLILILNRKKKNSR